MNRQRTSRRTHGQDADGARSTRRRTSEAAEFKLQVAKKADTWWTVLFIDPLALVVLRRMQHWQWITPARLTAGSAVMGVAAAVFFVTGHLVLGALCFEARFFFDCLDGKLARLRGIASPRGAFLDFGCDAVLISSILASLGWHLVARRDVSLTLILVVLVLCLVMFWLMLYRQILPSTAETPAPSDPDTAHPESRRDLVGDWFLRHRLVRSVRSVEIETLALFIAPLSGRVGLIVVGLLIASAYYLIGAIRLAILIHRSLPTSLARAEPKCGPADGDGSLGRPPGNEEGRLDRRRH